MKRFVAATSFVAVLGTTFALSKSSDLDILLRAGMTAKRHVTNILPESRKLAVPLSMFHAGDALPIEERVRLRIQMDKCMTGAELRVLPSDQAGEVRLRGVTMTSQQKTRAIELATGTTGVERIVDEIGVPEGK